MDQPRLNNFDKAPNNGAYAHQVLDQLTLNKLPLPKHVTWMIDDNEEDDIKDDTKEDSKEDSKDFTDGYYIFKWDTYLLVLFENGYAKVTQVPSGIYHIVNNIPDLVAYLGQRNTK